MASAKPRLDAVGWWRRTCTAARSGALRTRTRRTRNSVPRRTSGCWRTSVIDGASGPGGAVVLFGFEPLGAALESERCESSEAAPPDDVDVDTDVEEPGAGEDAAAGEL